MAKELLARNKKWAEKVTQEDPEFFARLENQQSPEYLWIGCSDSRVPANQILGLLPGEVFVHRNIGNQVIHTDLNCLSVIQYAVEVLKVKHIIVCGHYGCGGVHSAMSDEHLGLIDNWLIQLRKLISRIEPSLNRVKDLDLRRKIMCEVNVVAQVENLVRTSFVKNAWKSGQELKVHGWIYDLSDGLIRDLGVGAASIEQSNKDFMASIEQLIQIAEKG